MPVVGALTAAIAESVRAQTRARRGRMTAELRTHRGKEGRSEAREREERLCASFVTRCAQWSTPFLHPHAHGMSVVNAVSLRAPNTCGGTQARVKTVEAASRKGRQLRCCAPALLRYTCGPRPDAGQQSKREGRRERCEMPTRLSLRTLRDAQQVLAQRAEASGGGRGREEADKVSLCGALHVQRTVPRHTTGNALDARMQGMMGGGALVCGSAP